MLTTVASGEDSVTRVHVSGYFVRAVLEVLRSRGIGPEQILGSASAAVFSELAQRRVSLEEYQSLLQRAIELSGDQAFALDCGLQHSEASFGVISALVGHAPSLRHAIALVLRFGKVISEAVRLELVEKAGSARLRCRLHPASDRAMAEQIVSGLMHLLRFFGCSGADIHLVSFEYTRPAHHQAYARMFDGKACFEGLFTGIELTRAALDRPHVQWLPELQAVVLPEVERTVEQVSRSQTMTERVQACLLHRSERSLPSIVEVAKQLGTSERSLRRRLELEGTSYRQLAKRAKHDSACTLLRDPGQPIKTIAHTLGFSSQSSFQRAFTRWTSTTPLAYREHKSAR